MRIQHNIIAMNAYRNYTNNTSAMQKNLERLSSGYKINRAGDDAAGLAISEKMRAQITGLQAASKNAKDGISLVQTAEGALTEVHDMLNRMVELATQSANGTYAGDTDRTQLQKELDQLKEEINRIADSANFNGIKLLDGSMDSSTISGVTYGGLTESALQKLFGGKWDDDEVFWAGTNEKDVAAGNAVLETEGGAATRASFKISLDDLDISLNEGDKFTLQIGDDVLEFTAEADTSYTSSALAQELAKAAKEMDGGFTYNGYAFNVTAKDGVLSFEVSDEVTDDFKLNAGSTVVWKINDEIGGPEGSSIMPEIIAAGGISTAAAAPTVTEGTLTVGAQQRTAADDGEEATFTIDLADMAVDFTGWTDDTDSITFHISGKDFTVQKTSSINNMADVAKELAKQINDAVSGNNGVQGTKGGKYSAEWTSGTKFTLKAENKDAANEELKDLDITYDFSVKNIEDLLNNDTKGVQKVDFTNYTATENDEGKLAYTIDFSTLLESASGKTGKLTINIFGEDFTVEISSTSGTPATDAKAITDALLTKIGETHPGNTFTFGENEDTKITFTVTSEDGGVLKFKADKAAFPNDDPTDPFLAEGTKSVTISAAGVSGSAGKIKVEATDKAGRAPDPNQYEYHEIDLSNLKVEVKEGDSGKIELDFGDAGKVTVDLGTTAKTWQGAELVSKIVEALNQNKLTAAKADGDGVWNATVKTGLDTTLVLTSSVAGTTTNLVGTVAVTGVETTSDPTEPTVTGGSISKAASGGANDYVIDLSNLSLSGEGYAKFTIGGNDYYVQFNSDSTAESIATDLAEMLRTTPLSNSAGTGSWTAEVDAQDNKKITLTFNGDDGGGTVIDLTQGFGVVGSKTGKPPELPTGEVEEVGKETPSNVESVTTNVDFAATGNPDAKVDSDMVTQFSGKKLEFDTSGVKDKNEEALNLTKFSFDLGKVVEANEGKSMKELHSAIKTALKEAVKTWNEANKDSGYRLTNVNFFYGTYGGAKDQIHKLSTGYDYWLTGTLSPLGGGKSGGNIDSGLQSPVDNNSGAAAQLANVRVDFNEVNAWQDGAKITIGDTTYTVAVGENSKFKNVTNVVYLTEKEFEDKANLASVAAQRLAKAAEDNKYFVVGNDNGMTTLKQRSSAKEITDMSTKEKLLGYLGVGIANTNSIDTAKPGNALTLQIGDTADSYNQLKVSISDCHTASLGLDDISIAEQDNAEAALDKIKDAINYVSDVRGTLGATQNRLDHTINNLSVMTENITDAESTIRDTDIAEEMMAYTKNNILIQAAQAMLAQANQVPQGVLQLLQ